MRFFFMSDIHGYYYPMMRLLNFVNFNPKTDHIIFGGDMIDRGPDSALVLKTIKELQEKFPNNVKVLVGNHEEMMLWYYYGKSKMWLNYGGIEAFDSFNFHFKTTKTIFDYVKWIEKLPIAIENEHGVYCHAGIDLSHELNKQPRNVLWTTYDEFISLNKNELANYTNGKKIYRGHDPVKKAFSDDLRVFCDLGMGVLPWNEACLSLIDINNFSFYRYQLDNMKISLEPIRLIK